MSNQTKYFHTLRLNELTVIFNALLKITLPKKRITNYLRYNVTRLFHYYTNAIELNKISIYLQLNNIHKSKQLFSTIKPTQL